MATISLGNATATTPRETKISTSQPQNLTRAHTADAGHWWFDENPPDKSRDLTISVWQPPNRCESAPSSWSKLSGTIESPTLDCIGLEPQVPSKGGVLVMPEEPITLGHPPRPPKNERRLRVDLPPPTQEEDGHTPRGIVTPSPSSRSQRKYKQWGHLPPVTNAPAQEEGDPFMHPPSRHTGRDGSDYKESKESIARYTGGKAAIDTQQLTLSLETTQRGELTIQFTALYRQRQMSRAQQQFTLLRRCFYPKRDVIKWTGRLTGLSCEVLHFVQEPLTRLPCGANSTCVELPCTTILWFGVSFEDRTWRSSLSLGEHVHSPYACPSVEDHYFVGFEIRNFKPDASGAWFGSSMG